MEIKDLKTLKKFISLCRAQGVESIRAGGIELHLGPLPIKAKNIPKQLTTYIPGGVSEETKIVTDELSSEQLLMWSVGESQEVGSI